MKILAVTGNRADYDLLSYLYKKLNLDPEIELGLVVTGGHLAPGYENSIQEMENDGNRILARIENILDSDSLRSRPKAIGILMLSLIDVVSSFAPDLIICAGDREEVPAVALTAAYMRIPCLHFFGGEYVSDGHVDNLARNATSKLATVHAVSMEEHKRRLIAMGEDGERIHVIGSPALDKFREEPYVSREDLFTRLGRARFGEYALVIYHPPADITGENAEIRNILKVLDEKKICACVSYPNTDFNNSSVIREFKPYERNERFFFFKNLKRNDFVNLYRNASFQIGNSSSGIGESASIPVPVINVGSRERDRADQKNVIFTDGSETSIAAAVDEVSSEDFKNRIAGMKNQFGDGHSSQRAYELIKNTDFRKLLMKTSDPLRNKR